MIRALNGVLYELPDHVLRSPNFAEDVKEWWAQNHVDDLTYLNHTVKVMSTDDEDDYPVFNVIVNPYILRIPSARILPFDPSENSLGWREITNMSVIRYVLRQFEDDIRRALPSAFFGNPDPMVAEWIMSKNDISFKYGYPTYGYAGNPDPRVIARMKTLIESEKEYADAYGFDWDESVFSYPYYHALYINPSPLMKTDVLKSLKGRPRFDCDIRRFCALMMALASHDTDVMLLAWTRIDEILRLTFWEKWDRLKMLQKVVLHADAAAVAEKCLLPCMTDPNHVLHNDIWKFRAVYECSDERVVQKCLDKYLQTGECQECLSNPSPIIVDWLMTSPDPHGLRMIGRFSTRRPKWSITFLPTLWILNI